MKKRNIFWGILFVLGAIGLIVGKMGFLSGVNPFSLGFSVILGVIIIDSLFRLNYAGILFPIAFLCIIYDKQLGITSLTPWTVLISALFGSIGLSMIFPKKTKFYKKKSYWSVEEGENINIEDEANIKISSAFSGGTKYINTDKFVSADISCKYSGLEIYFDNAIMAEDTALLRLDVSFSGLEIYIPRSWNVENRTNVFLGGIENKKYRDKVYTNTLILTGDVRLSGVEIHYI